MAVLWSADCEGTDGTNVTIANSDFVDCVPNDSALAQYDATNAHVGTTCIEYVTSAVVTHKTSTWTAEGTVWWDGYVWVATAPTSNTVLAQFFSQAGGVAAELRYQVSGGTVGLRDSTFGLRVEAALVSGWNRVAAKVAPEEGGDLGLEVYVYNGANLDTMTPTSSDTSSAGTNWGAATGIVRGTLGVLSTPGNTATIRLDDVTIGDTQRTVGATATYDLTATYTTDTTDIASWSLDATGSVGTTSLTQTSGTTVGTITESPTGVFAFSNPSGTDDLVFDLDAGTDTAVVTIARSAGRPAYYSKTASGWV